ncbi:MAG TPA: UvrB/UvrC motif-containing protein, partial [Isosphaeraceae bacterium]|nr:UvrB/UvrC motif-containing protein [Isosphaeraceae bacterium]
QAKAVARKAVGRDENTEVTEEYLNELEAEMLQAAENLEFERAAALRDRIMELRAGENGQSARPSASAQATSARAKAKAGKGKRGQRRPKPL